PCNTRQWSGSAVCAYLGGRAPHSRSRARKTATLNVCRVNLRGSARVDRAGEQVVEILQVAAGDGRLSLTELDERLDAALSARTIGELKGLTADLPLEGMP